MLLNLFFENINSNLELLLIGAFIFAIYWFIMRKYNSLGLRMFIMCFLLFGATCTWLYQDEKALKNTLTTGEQHEATILGKSTVGKNDHELSVSFVANNGKKLNTQTSKYVSQQEWDRFKIGQTLPVIYVAGKDQAFVKESAMRFKADKIYLYYFSGFWLVLGTVLYFWLRKLKVKVDEKTGDEWVEREDGTVIEILDERKSRTSRALKRANILSKIAQAVVRS
ncbi:MAG: hypothetical protein ABIX01_03605 [Chitinophagaceae bacterium]